MSGAFEPSAPHRMLSIRNPRLSQPYPLPIRSPAPHPENRPVSGYNPGSLRGCPRLACALLLGMLPRQSAAQAPAPAPEDVEIRRTAYGVPHVRASTLYGAGFGLAWAEVEDHGERVVLGLVAARGQEAEVEPSEAARTADVQRVLRHERAVETWPDLSPDVREFMEGFAAGVTRFLALYPEERPGGREWSFSGVDVHAMQIGSWNAGLQRRFLQALLEGGADPGREAEHAHPEDGSNAWALAPSRTRNGHAILLRNPHLSWEAGYYEAHVRVPGQLDFYGDFRVGGLFGIVGGFNPYLGWATTNNGPDLDEIYELRLDPDRPDRYAWEGAFRPVERRTVVIRAADSLRVARERAAGRREIPESWLSEVSAEVETTLLGPVIHRTADRLYVMRSTNDGEWRRGEQFFRMMRAQSLDEWRAAMRMQAISASNYTYADRDGNIFYVWNAKLPRLPHPPSELDVVSARGWADVADGLVPFDSLPQLLNPEGGYVRNENDPPWLTNLHEPLDPAAFPPNIPGPRLRLRSQHSLELLHNERAFTLEDVVEAKHSPRMLIAERVKADLVHAVGVSDSDAEIRRAARLVDGWDGTTVPEARGAVLFRVFWARYTETVDSTRIFREPWDPARPIDTPRGLGALTDAVRAFSWAVQETRLRHGSWDVTWGEAHRVRHGGVDLPVAGCPGALGCFRVLGFGRDDDGRWSVRRGDGWVLAVEFADAPRAYSVLAYGQSSREGSPHHADQAAMFARGEMKPVAFTEEDIEADLLGRYRPGEPTAASSPGAGGR